MARIKAQSNTKARFVEVFALEFMSEWNWPNPQRLLEQKCSCMHAGVHPSLKVSGTAEYTMSSGVTVRALAFHCLYCRNRLEIRQIRDNDMVSWSELYYVHNGEYAGAVYPKKANKHAE
jgi:hypothetical protein